MNGLSNGTLDSGSRNGRDSDDFSKESSNEDSRKRTRSTCESKESYGKDHQNVNNSIYALNGIHTEDLPNSIHLKVESNQNSVNDLSNGIHSNASNGTHTKEVQNDSRSHDLFKEINLAHTNGSSKCSSNIWSKRVDYYSNDKLKKPENFFDNISTETLNNYNQYSCGLGDLCCKNRKEHYYKDPEEILFDENEFTPYDPTQEAIFPPELMVILFSVITDRLIL